MTTTVFFEDASGRTVGFLTLSTSCAHFDAFLSQYLPLPLFLHPSFIINPFSAGFPHLLCKAPAGSGKTLMFIPLAIQKVISEGWKSGQGPSVFVTVRTNILIQQLQDEFTKLADDALGVGSVFSLFGEDKPAKLAGMAKCAICIGQPEALCNIGRDGGHLRKVKVSAFPC